MKNLKNLHRPSKDEQKVALESYDALSAVLRSLDTDIPEIEIAETKEKIRIPLRVLKLLNKILEATAEGKPISVVPVATEVTTQKAAEYLGCSRPHLVKLLEEGKIPFTKIGKHRRIRFEHLLKYEQITRENQRKLLIKMMQDDEDIGLYDL